MIILLLPILNHCLTNWINPLLGAVFSYSSFQTTTTSPCFPLQFDHDKSAGFEVPGTFPPSHFDSASGMAPLPIKLRAIALATLAKTFTKTISIVAHGSLINKHVIVKN